MRRPFLVFGTSALSRLWLELADARARGLLAGFTVDRAYMIDDQFCGVPVYPFEDLPDRFPPETYDILAPLRYAAMNRDRQRVFERLRAVGYRLPGYIHPSTQVSDRAVLGANVIAFQDNVIRAGAVVGDNAFFWNRVLVDAEARVGAHSFLTGGAVVDRSAVVGRNSFIGPGAFVSAGRTVGAFSMVGGGALIVRDCRERSVYGAASGVYDADG